MSEKVKEYAEPALKKNLFKKVKEIEIDGVKFVIRRPTRLEIFNSKLDEYGDKTRDLMDLIARENDPEKKSELRKQLKEVNFAYEKELIRLCVVEPDLGESPEDVLDTGIWFRLVREISDFVFVAPFRESFPPRK